MWLVGVVVRRYIDFLILLIPTPLVSALFCISIPLFVNFFIILYINVITGWMYVYTVIIFVYITVNMCWPAVL